MKKGRLNGNYFNINPGQFCGIIAGEKLAKKIAKLLAKQNNELKDLLSEYKDELMVYNWTLAYPDGVQSTVHFVKPYDTDDVVRRIEMFNKQAILKKIDNLFVADDMKEAERIYMEHFGHVETEATHE